MRPKKLDIPAYPTKPQFDQWFRMVAQNCCVANGYDDFGEIAWLKQANEKDAKPEQFVNIEPRFRLLDQELAQGLRHCFQKAGDHCWPLTMRRIGTPNCKFFFAPNEDHICKS